MKYQPRSYQRPLRMGLRPKLLREVRYEYPMGMRRIWYFKIFGTGGWLSKHDNIWVKRGALAHFDLMRRFWMA